MQKNRLYHTIPAHRASAQGKARTLVMIKLSIAMVLMLAAVLVWQGYQALEDAESKAQEQSLRLAESVSSHMELTLLAVDMTLQRASERHYFNSMFGNQLLQDMEHNFRRWVRETPQIHGLYMANRDGTVVLEATRPKGRGVFPVGSSLLKQEFFTNTLMQAKDDESSLAIHHPSGSRDAAALLVKTRPIYSMSGEVEGGVFAVIDPRYFLDFFRSIEVLPGHFMALFCRKAEIVASGSSSETANLILSDMAQKRQIAEDYQRSAGSQNWDGKEVTLAMERLKKSPLWLAIVLDETHYLQQWRKDRRRDIGFFVAFVVFGAVLSYLIWSMSQQIERVEASEDRALMASQAKSDFLASMSHELRTPLNAIIGFSEMIDAGYFGKLTAKQKDRIHDIHVCGNHLLQLINDILEFSKAEAGKLELSESWFDIKKTMEECLRIMAAKPHSEALKFELDVPSAIQSFYGDQRKIRQLLLNLLSNALRFTEKGSITLSLRVNEAGEAVVSLQDTGIGMREEDIPVALSVFGQVHRHTHPEGTGLGLPLCRMFAEMHGAELHLESAEQQGTTVSITFPASRYGRPESDTA